MPHHRRHYPLWAQTAGHHPRAPVPPADSWFIRPLNRSRFEIACSNTDFQYFLELTDGDHIPPCALYRLSQVLFDMHFACIRRHRKCASVICVAGDHNSEQTLSVNLTLFGTYLRHLNIPLGLTLDEWKNQERPRWDAMFLAAGLTATPDLQPKSHKTGKKLRSFYRKLKKDSPYCEEHFDKAYMILRHLDPAVHRSNFDIPIAPLHPPGRLIPPSV